MNDHFSFWAKFEPVFIFMFFLGEKMCYWFESSSGLNNSHQIIYICSQLYLSLPVRFKESAALDPIKKKYDVSSRLFDYQKKQPRSHRSLKSSSVDLTNQSSRNVDRLISELGESWRYKNNDTTRRYHYNISLTWSLNKVKDINSSFRDLYVCEERKRNRLLHHLFGVPALSNVVFNWSTVASTFQASTVASTSRSRTPSIFDKESKCLFCYDRARYYLSALIICMLCSYDVSLAMDMRSHQDFCRE